MPAVNNLIQLLIFHMADYVIFSGIPLSYIIKLSGNYLHKDKEAAHKINNDM
ncbi:MAG: hypothetical protein WCD89_13110 [Anaerocolumna sp.]